MPATLKGDLHILVRRILLGCQLTEIAKRLSFSLPRKIASKHSLTVFMVFNRYIVSGKLKASKIGRWRIKQSDLDKFLEETSNIKRKKK